MFHGAAADRALGFLGHLAQTSVTDALVPARNDGVRAFILQADDAILFHVHRGRSFGTASTLSRMITF